MRYLVTLLLFCSTAFAQPYGPHSQQAINAAKGVRTVIDAWASRFEPGTREFDADLRRQGYEPLYNQFGEYRETRPLGQTGQVIEWGQELFPYEQCPKFQFVPAQFGRRMIGDD